MNYCEKLKERVERMFPEWKSECCGLLYPDPEEIQFCLECGQSLRRVSGKECYRKMKRIRHHIEKRIIR